MAEEILIVHAAFPSIETGRTIVATLIEEGLIAAASLFPRVESVYPSGDTVQAASEVSAMLKTTRSCLLPLAKRYRALHPRHLARFLTVSVDDGLPDYVRWLEESLSGAADQAW